MNHYDVLIVGAGIGGLTCGARLAIRGYKVAVFDHHYLPGGYATNFHRKGYTFDVALHGVGGLAEGQSFYQILHSCDVMQHIHPIPKEHPYSVRWNGQKMNIPQDVQAYRLFLHELFPAEKEGIDHLFQDIHKLQREINFITDSRIANWKKAVLIPVKCRILMKWSNLTTDQVMKQYTKDEEFMIFFTVLWGYYGLPPQQLSSLYFFIPWIGYHIEGSYYIQGGSQSLADAFVNVIEENGGTLYLSHEVTEILVNHQQAYGVQTHHMMKFTGNWVVSNASPQQTLGKLVGTDPRVESYLTKISKKQIGSSITQLYIGLSCHPEEIGIYDEDLLFVEESDHQTDSHHLMQGRYDIANFSVTNYSKLDPSLNHYNQGVIVISLLDDIRNWDEDKKSYQQRKKEVTAILLQRLESYFPSLRDKVVITELATPRTMERYTKNPGGAVYGFAQTVNQAGLKRTNQKTPISRLSLVGAWTQPGGGFQGASMSGFNEAERIHKQLMKDRK